MESREVSYRSTTILDAAYVRLIEAEKLSKLVLCQVMDGPVGREYLAHITPRQREPRRGRCPEPTGRCRQLRGWRRCIRPPGQRPSPPACRASSTEITPNEPTENGAASLAFSRRSHLASQSPTMRRRLYRRQVRSPLSSEAGEPFRNRALVTRRHV